MPSLAVFPSLYNQGRGRLKLSVQEAISSWISHKSLILNTGRTSFLPRPVPCLGFSDTVQLTHRLIPDCWAVELGVTIS